MRSVTGRGQEFLQEQKASNEQTTMVAPITFKDNKKQINSASTSKCKAQKFKYRY